MTLLLFLLGLLALVVGAELLVRGASRLAGAAGISPLVVGLTVVAFGTSAPELAVSVQSSLSGQTGVALGNVVGSNVFNVLFILGLSALITPLVVARQLVRREVPLMIGASIFVLLLGLDGGFQRLDGALLFAGLLAFTVYAIVRGRQEGADTGTEADVPSSKPLPTWLALVLLVVGLGLLVLGSTWLVDGATTFARSLGVSEMVIGLTIVAVGTSLPEVATSVMAALRGERDIAVGNVVGSNLFNLLGVLGVGALFAPTPLELPEGALSFELPVMIGTALLCLPIFLTGHRIDRWEGAVFFGFYLAYGGALYLEASAHPWWPGYVQVMLWLVIPMVGLTLAVHLARRWREGDTESVA